MIGPFIFFDHFGPMAFARTCGRIRISGSRR
jgi:hypothetical protein